jgi:hypothetical protein
MLKIYDNFIDRVGKNSVHSEITPEIFQKMQC